MYSPEQHRIAYSKFLTRPFWGPIINFTLGSSNFSTIDLVLSVDPSSLMTTSSLLPKFDKIEDNCLCIYFSPL